VFSIQILKERKIWSGEALQLYFSLIDQYCIYVYIGEGKVFSWDWSKCVPNVKPFKI
jgi:hypothetical protein